MTIIYALESLYTINGDAETAMLDLLATDTDPMKLRDRFNTKMNTREMAMMYGSRPNMRDYEFSTTHYSCIDDLDERYEWEFTIRPMPQFDQEIRVSDWIAVDHCAVRLIEGGDVDNPADRVAFIEKTPSVRIAPFEDESGDNRNWDQGPKGSSGHGDRDGYGFYQPSRDWCDRELRRMGYILS